MQILQSGLYTGERSYNLLLINNNVTRRENCFCDTEPYQGTKNMPHGSESTYTPAGVWNRSKARSSASHVTVGVFVASWWPSALW